MAELYSDREINEQVDWLWECHATAGRYSQAYLLDWRYEDWLSYYQTNRFGVAVVIKN